MPSESICNNKISVSNQRFDLLNELPARSRPRGDKHYMRQFSRSLQCQPFSAAFDGVSRTRRFKYVGRNPGLGSGCHNLGDLIEGL